jgi:hypothetical protein
MDIFKKFSFKNIDIIKNTFKDKSNDSSKNEIQNNNVSIFDKESFSLKELCNLFLVLSNTKQIPSDIIRSFSKDYYRKIIITQNEIDNNEIFYIYECYINFSSGNEKYRDFLRNTRLLKGLIIINNKKIYFREILQEFDNNFNKLVIRIDCKSSNYDINITWKQFEEKIKNLTKNELEKIINKN